MKDLLGRWKQTRELALQSQADEGGPQRIRLYPVVVSFEGVQDPLLRSRLMALPTSFSLPNSDVDLLRKVAGDLLRSSPNFNDFVRDMKEQ